MGSTQTNVRWSDDEVVEEYKDLPLQSVTRSVSDSLGH